MLRKQLKINGLEMEGGRHKAGGSHTNVEKAVLPSDDIGNGKRFFM